jgi:hypothetical protein
MPHADPEKRAEYNRARWRSHGHIYRAQRASSEPPLSRHQVLDQDIGQQQALELLEATRLGRQRAHQRFAGWLKAERTWLHVSSTPFVIGGLDVSDR